MRLSKKLTTVTPFSKYAALSLFIILPILAFFYGRYYQNAMDQNTNPIADVKQKQTADTLVITTPFPTNIPNPTGIPLAHDGYFTISQWHIRAPYNGTLDLEYSPSPPGERPTIFLSSAQLNAGGTSNSNSPDLCITSKGAAGNIERFLPTDEVAQGETAQQFLSQDFKALNSTPPLYTKVGDYYYIYMTGQSEYCSNTKLLTQTQNTFKMIIPQLTSYK